MSELAIFGGRKIRTTNFPSQNTYNENEKEALKRVFNFGRPSGYRANKGPHSMGGPEIQGLELSWSYKFNVNGQAIACNSATSGLFIACAAIGLKQGDEVIVTPYSMTCSATVPLWFGATPVFADVEEDYFCIDPKSVVSLITEKTKAIIAVDIFGQPCDYSNLKSIIREAEEKYKKEIYLISDCAQAPGSKYFDRYSGTIADISVFSLNFGKHMTCGEGGMIVTNSGNLENRCRLIMNHAESVMNDIYDSGEESIHYNMIGLNLRMTEFQAAVAREQLKKLDYNIETRRENVMNLNIMLSQIPAITPAKIRCGCTHSYYVAAYLWDKSKANSLHRDKFIEVVKAELTPRDGRDGEGVQIGCGYIKPIYQMPWRKDQEAIHRPVVESLYKEKLFLTIAHAPNSTTNDMIDIGKAFNKVWEYRSELV
ncbi:hypothetical protein A2619_04370 [candidate division WWE3 bacterium RIFOXYD1_FULL_39_9]|uniref:DegT/DnrJ/EryC1/StrS aminotransferase n=1 Tax=candidate division WWE3 bacterium RIFOXYD1_FULL_39_9 TaxID=1802649 RepID=A0A1F4X6A7_UNCKA|nr:MAG: hypothetical protein A2619_04370 [candidate division WWE3 bacterium RIFOXYD1_FULL_39_9]